MVSQIVWLGVRDVFTQIAKDVVGQELDHGTLTFKFTIVLKGDGKYWFRPLVEGIIDRGPKSACRD
ncbi:hypothetical protein YC2023_089171 [Brassica napus]